MIDTQTTSWFKDASQQTRKKKKKKNSVFLSYLFSHLLSTLIANGSSTE